MSTRKLAGLASARLDDHIDRSVPLSAEELILKEIHAPVVIRPGARRPYLATLPAAGAFSPNSNAFLALQPANRFVIATYPADAKHIKSDNRNGDDCEPNPPVGCGVGPVHSDRPNSAISTLPTV